MTHPPPTRTLAIPTRAVMVMARPSQLALIGLVYSAGVLVGVWRGTPAAGMDAAPGLLLVLSAAVAVHWANEAADADTDALTTRTRFSGGSGALPDSGLAPTVLLRGALGLAIAVVGAAVVSIALGRLPVAAGSLLVLGLVGGLAYSVAPIALMRRGMGEPINALLGGLALPLYGIAAARGRVDPLDIVAFLPFCLVVFCSVLATAWPDRVADGATGKRTLQVRLPRSWLRRMYGASATGWAVTVVVAGATGAFPNAFLVLAIMPLVVLGARRYTRQADAWPSVAAMVGHVGLMVAATAVAVL